MPGGKTDKNAHPHMDFDNRIALVHNGTINNATELRRELQAKGIFFRSETDSEVGAVPHRPMKSRPLIALNFVCYRCGGEYLLGSSTSRCCSSLFAGFALVSSRRLWLPLGCLPPLSV